MTLTEEPTIYMASSQFPAYTVVVERIVQTLRFDAASESPSHAVH